MNKELRPRDKIYLASPSFELYMIAGGVFVAGITISFIGTMLIHMEPLFWPGILLSVGVAYGVLEWLKRREYAAKLREIAANPDPDNKQPPQ